MKEKIKNFILIILILAFTVCSFIGARMGEQDIVFQKASQICMECIGIG